MHRHLDGMLQVLLGDVEAVVVDLPVLQDVLMLTGLMEDRQDQTTWLTQMVEKKIENKKKAGRSCKRLLVVVVVGAQRLLGQQGSGPGSSSLCHTCTDSGRPQVHSARFKIQNTDFISLLR